MAKHTPPVSSPTGEQSPTTKLEDLEKLHARAKVLEWDPDELRAFLADLIAAVSAP